IALGAAGTDIALETADIALMRDDLGLIPRALSLARRTRRNIRQNVVIALVTVTALLTGVLFQQVHMAGGMLIHEASVMVVILNGMRLLGRRRNQKGSAGVLEPQTVP
ncbi:MAG: heavy metal translocating P-type ATPase, partial [Alkalispirochaeta sp.]